MIGHGRGQPKPSKPPFKAVVGAPPRRTPPPCDVLTDGITLSNNGASSRQPVGGPSIKKNVASAPRVEDDEEHEGPKLVFSKTRNNKSVVKSLQNRNSINQSQDSSGDVLDSFNNMQIGNSQIVPGNVACNGSGDPPQADIDWYLYMLSRRAAEAVNNLKFDKQFIDELLDEETPKFKEFMVSPKTLYHSLLIEIAGNCKGDVFNGNCINALYSMYESNGEAFGFAFREILGSHPNPDVGTFIVHGLTKFPHEARRHLFSFLYKDSSGVLRLFDSCSSEGSRLLLSAIVEFADSAVVDECIRILRKQPDETKEIGVPPSQTTDIKADDPYCSIRHILSKAGLDNYVSVFEKHAIPDKMLFGLQEPELEQLLTEAGLPLGVKFKVRQSLFRKESPQGHAQPDPVISCQKTPSYQTTSSDDNREQNGMPAPFSVKVPDLPLNPFR